jgi:hypothetical protein
MLADHLVAAAAMRKLMVGVMNDIGVAPRFGRARCDGDASRHGGEDGRQLSRLRQTAQETRFIHRNAS